MANIPPVPLPNASTPEEVSDAFEEYGLSADTMLGWLQEMVTIPKWRLDELKLNDLAHDSRQR